MGDFSLVYPDLRQSPRCQSRDIGTTVAGQRGPDDQKTLADCKFVIGDFLDIAITPRLVEWIGWTVMAGEDLEEIEGMEDSETETVRGTVSEIGTWTGSGVAEIGMAGTGFNLSLYCTVLCNLCTFCSYLICE